MGVSQERGESYYVPGTGAEMVRRRTNFSPVPGTFTPKLGRTLKHFSELYKLKLYYALFRKAALVEVNDDE